MRNESAIRKHELDLNGPSIRHQDCAQGSEEHERQEADDEQEGSPACPFFDAFDYAQ